jgi:hypothetical protein
MKPGGGFAYGFLLRVLRLWIAEVGQVGFHMSE